MFTSSALQPSWYDLKNLAGLIWSGACHPKVAVLLNPFQRSLQVLLQIDVLPQATLHVSTMKMVTGPKGLFVGFNRKKATLLSHGPRSVSFSSSTFSFSFSFSVVRLPFNLFICSEIAFRHPFFPYSLEPTWVAESSLACFHT